MLRLRWRLEEERGRQGEVFGVEGARLCSFGGGYPVQSRLSRSISGRGCKILHLRRGLGGEKGWRGRVIAVEGARLCSLGVGCLIFLGASPNLILAEGARLCSLGGG